MSPLMIILLVLLLLWIGVLPRWGHSRNWGYGPSGGLGIILVIVLILILTGTIRVRAEGGKFCWPWEVVKETLLEKYKETPIGGGVLNPTAIVQVFSSIDGKTFSIVIVHNTGMGCVMASGTGWEPGLNPKLSL